MAAARPDGLGATFAGRVPLPAGVAGWLVLARLAAVVQPWRGRLAVVLAAAAILLVRRTVRRFGGVTGHVYGEAIETTLAVLLLALTR